jgi:chitinase
MRLRLLFCAFLLLGCQRIKKDWWTPHLQAMTAGKPVLAGYWHNWEGSAGWLPLRDVPPMYDWVKIAFALPDESGSGAITFRPDRRYEAGAFARDVAHLQQRGTKVILSIGGGRHPVELQTEAMRRAFVESVIRLCRQYRFDGIDLNLEGKSIVLDPGDLDFRNPTSPKILNMIAAVREIRARTPHGFLITAAPETLPVTGGFGNYGGNSGGWLPLLHHLRDVLDMVHIQLYNSGTQFALIRGDDPEQVRIVTQGTPEFVWGVAEMLILGFPVNRNAQQWFPGLGAQRVSLGFPASPQAAGGGYIPPQELRPILRRLVTGRGSPRRNHPMRSPRGYPDLGGVMTWSINWDAQQGDGREAFAFARSIKR